MNEGLILLAELALMLLLLLAVVRAGQAPDEEDLGLFGFRRRMDTARSPGHRAPSSTKGQHRA